MNSTRLRYIAFLSLAVGALAVVGCATPEARINKNPELFASFPPEIQEKVRQGQIDVGFTGEMVTMALGEPNRIYTRQTSTGIHEVWSYTTTITRNERQRINADVRYRDGSGRYKTNSDWVWVDVPRETEYESIRVEFQEGKVAAIETLQR